MHFPLQEYPHRALLATTPQLSSYRSDLPRPLIRRLFFSLRRRGERERDGGRERESHHHLVLAQQLTGWLCRLQDPELATNPGAPAFLLKLSNEDELMFTFTFNVRQTPTTSPDPNSNTVDTQINGLTYVYASTSREVENLVTREFHADPNLHKNSNVELIGDFTTGGSGSVTFDWAWKWKPPRNAEDSGGGWRNSCSVCSKANVAAWTPI